MNLKVNTAVEFVPTALAPMSVVTRIYGKPTVESNTDRALHANNLQPLVLIPGENTKESVARNSENVFFFSVEASTTKYVQIQK